MRKIILLLIFGIFLIGLASASFGNYKQGQEVNLLQTCADCSFNNITSILAPDGTQLVGSSQMTKTGNVYNYTLAGGLTTQIGEYTVNGFGDPGGTNEVWMYHFNIGGGNLVFFIFAFVLFFGLMIYGIKIQNPWVSLIGCFGVSALGVYTALNGIGADKNTLTTTISTITVAIGVGIGFQAARDVTNL